MSSGQFLEDRLTWDFADEGKFEQFYNLVELNVQRNASVCFSPYYDSVSHKCDLDSSWTNFAEVIRVSGRTVFGVSQNREHTIPGWSFF